MTSTDAPADGYAIEQYLGHRWKPVAFNLWDREQAIREATGYAKSDPARVVKANGAIVWQSGKDD